MVPKSDRMITMMIKSIVADSLRMGIMPLDLKMDKFMFMTVQEIKSTILMQVIVIIKSMPWILVQIHRHFSLAGEKV